MPNAVTVPEAVWQGEVPFSPNLAGFAPGIALAMGDGELNHEPRGIAAIRYRMPDPVVRRYRGHIVPAIFLVAIDAESGEVYAGPCIGQDAPPAIFDRTASPAAVMGAPAVGGTVNVDIVAHLALPPHAARYLVVAWLDEWVSAARVFDVAADAQRQISPIHRPANAPGAVQTLARPLSSGAASLAISVPAAGTLRASWNVATPGPVVLLAYGLEQRRMYWEIVAPGTAPLARAGTAEVAVASFLDAPGAKAFALVAGDQVTVVAPVGT